jgi:S-adenosylmethionine:tRNA-ribosyltransferase-isomerase (queuine synthetase)
VRLEDLDYDLPEALIAQHPYDIGTHAVRNKVSVYGTFG